MKRQVLTHRVKQELKKESQRIDSKMFKRLESENHSISDLIRAETVSFVVSALILGLLKTMDQTQLVKGSTISYMNLMRMKMRKSKATIEERSALSVIVRESMMQLVEQFSEGTTPMQVATFVESLSFSFEKELNQYYGQEYMLRMMRFTDKQEVDSSLAKDSYKISDQLRENIRKIIFDKVNN